MLTGVTGKQQRPRVTELWAQKASQHVPTLTENEEKDSKSNATKLSDNV